MIISKVKLSKKITISILAAVLILVFVSSSVFAYDYYSAKKLEREGDSLVEAERYDEALSKYALAKSRLFYKPEVKQKIDKILGLQTSQVYLQKCREFFEEKDYENAVLTCRLLQKDSRYYSEAEKLASSAEELKIKAKEMEEQDKVRGAKTNIGIQPQPQSNQNNQKAIEDLKQRQEKLAKLFQELINLTRQCTESGAGVSFCNNLHLPFINSLMLQINDLKIKIAELESQN